MPLVLDRPVTLPVEIPFTPVYTPIPLNPDGLERILATPDTFAKWLSQFEDDTIIGCASDSASCPIANWLHDVGFDDVSVGMVDIMLDDNHGTYVMPRWASRFVVDIDDGDRDTDRTAADARKSLAYATSE